MGNNTISKEHQNMLVMHQTATEFIWMFQMHLKREA